MAQEKNLPNIKELFLMLQTFGLTVFAWIFFRAENIGHAFNYISQIFSKTLFSTPNYHNDDSAKPIFLLIFLFIIIEWLGRKKQHPLSNIVSIKNRYYRWGIYIILSIVIFIFKGNQQEFIYFQF